MPYQRSVCGVYYWMEVYERVCFSNKLITYIICQLRLSGY